VKSWTVFAIFLLLATIRSTSQRPPSEEQSHVEPALINTCLITNDVKTLTAFYSQVLQIEPRKSGDDYVEFPTKVGTLALFAATAEEKYIPGSAKAGQNHSSILEFRVGNVDEEYARLHPVVKSWVKGPTTQPWGTRSIYFRDPDGNLVDFFTPAAAK
jgi:catechol 2,3-dioxygenase-like lactoylglutathione lyase family enzyme